MFFLNLGIYICNSILNIRTNVSKTGYECELDLILRNFQKKPYVNHFLVITLERCISCVLYLSFTYLTSVKSLNLHSNYSIYIIDKFFQWMCFNQWQLKFVKTFVLRQYKPCWWRYLIASAKEDMTVFVSASLRWLRCCSRCARSPPVQSSIIRYIFCKRYKRYKGAIFLKNRKKPSRWKTHTKYMKISSESS